jgi:hypothetical protein
MRGAGEVAGLVIVKFISSACAREVRMGEIEFAADVAAEWAFALVGFNNSLSTPSSMSLRGMLSASGA